MGLWAGLEDEHEQGDEDRQEWQDEEEEQGGGWGLPGIVCAESFLNPVRVCQRRYFHPMPKSLREFHPQKDQFSLLMKSLKIERSHI